MATVNFSVPDDVRNLFNATFAHANKSAIIAELMREAIAREARVRASQNAVNDIIARHPAAPIRSAASLNVARRAGRV
jgi:hypothetical protein